MGVGCSKEGCGRKHYGFGLCQMHYKARRRSDPSAHTRDNEKRRLNRQRAEVKAREGEQNRARYFSNHEQTLERKRELAAKNRADPEKGERLREYKRGDYRQNADKIRERIRMHNTGFTIGLLQALRDFQKGLCAICEVEMILGGRSPHSECADHYETDLEGNVVRQMTKGAIKHPRGLLCGACNKSLGHYERYQHPVGLVIEPYEKYLSNPPARQVPSCV